MEKQTDVLSREHGIILKMINVLEKKCEDLSDKKEIDRKFFEQAIDFIRNYADKFHHAKEENILFIEFNKRAHLASCNPVEQMLYEHKMGREYTNSMEKGLNENDLNLIKESGLQYVHLLREHIMKEDNILYPIIDDVLDEKTQKSITEQAEKVEKEKFNEGFVDKYSLLVDDLYR